MVCVTMWGGILKLCLLALRFKVRDLEPNVPVVPWFIFKHFLQCTHSSIHLAMNLSDWSLRDNKREHSCSTGAEGWRQLSVPLHSGTQIRSHKMKWQFWRDVWHITSLRSQIVLPSKEDFAHTLLPLYDMGLRVNRIEKCHCIFDNPTLLSLQWSNEPGVLVTNGSEGRTMIITEIKCPSTTMTNY